MPFQTVTPLHGVHGALFSADGSPPRAWGRRSSGSLARGSRPVHPHVRGDDDHDAGAGVRDVRFTPTCVGTTNGLTLVRAQPPVHPHVRGDDGHLHAGVAEQVRFTAPERVFRAITDAKEIPAWWGSDDMYRTTKHTADLRVGGKWRSEGKGKDGNEFAVEGEFVEIDPPRKPPCVRPGSPHGTAATPPPSPIAWSPSREARDSRFGTRALTPATTPAAAIPRAGSESLAGSPPT